MCFDYCVPTKELIWTLIFYFLSNNSYVEWWTDEKTGSAISQPSLGPNIDFYLTQICLRIIRNQESLYLSCIPSPLCFMWNIHKPDCSSAEEDIVAFFCLSDFSITEPRCIFQDYILRQPLLTCFNQNVCATMAPESSSVIVNEITPAGSNTATPLQQSASVFLPTRQKWKKELMLMFDSRICSSRQSADLEEKSLICWVTDRNEEMITFFGVMRLFLWMVTELQYAVTVVCH